MGASHRRRQSAVLHHLAHHREGPAPWAAPAIGRFLIQKEVAQRIAAPPGSRDYGYLSVASQILAETEILFTVPPEAFKPPPKVDSAVVRLRPRPQPLAPDLEAFLSFASACFAHKRKNLRNNLSGRYDPGLISAQPEAGLRAEQLPVEQMADLQRRLESQHRPH